MVERWIRIRGQEASGNNTTQIITTINDKECSKRWYRKDTTSRRNETNEVGNKECDAQNTHEESRHANKRITIRRRTATHLEQKHEQAQKRTQTQHQENNCPRNRLSNKRKRSSERHMFMGVGSWESMNCWEYGSYIFETNHPKMSWAARFLSQLIGWIAIRAWSWTSDVF